MGNICCGEEQVETQSTESQPLLSSTGSLSPPLQRDTIQKENEDENLQHVEERQRKEEDDRQKELLREEEERREAEGRKRQEEERQRKIAERKRIALEKEKEIEEKRKEEEKQKKIEEEAKRRRAEEDRRRKEGEEREEEERRRTEDADRFAKEEGKDFEGDYQVGETNITASGEEPGEEQSLPPLEEEGAATPSKDIVREEERADSAQSFTGFEDFAAQFAARNEITLTEEGELPSSTSSLAEEGGFSGSSPSLKEEQLTPLQALDSNPKLKNSQRLQTLTKDRVSFASRRRVRPKTVMVKTPERVEGAAPPSSSSKLATSFDPASALRARGIPQSNLEDSTNSSTSSSTLEEEQAEEQVEEPVKKFRPPPGAMGMAMPMFDPSQAKKKLRSSVYIPKAEKESAPSPIIGGASSLRKTVSVPSKAPEPETKQQDFRSLLKKSPKPEQ